MNNWITMSLSKELLLDNKARNLVLASVLQGEIDARPTTSGFSGTPEDFKIAKIEFKECGGAEVRFTDGYGMNWKQVKFVD